MVQHGMITNRLNSKGDSYFVSSKNKLMDDMQKECNSGTENESNVNPERLSNIEIEERSPSSSINCLKPTSSNLVVVNKYEDRFEKLENRINSLEDLTNKELVWSKTVLENNGPYDNHQVWEVKFLREEISSKNYIKTLLENISQINNSFCKNSNNQNIKQNDNAEIWDDFAFQK